MTDHQQTLNTPATHKPYETQSSFTNCLQDSYFTQDSDRNQSANETFSTDKCNISVGSLNVCGLKRRSNYPDFQDLLKSYDLFFVSESKLDQYDVISVDGFTFKNKPRQQKYIRRSGGVGIFVRNELDKFVQAVESESEYAFWVKLSKNFTKLDQDIVFGSVYIPPSQSRFLNEDEFDTFQRDVMSICSNFEYVYFSILTRR